MTEVDKQLVAIEQAAERTRQSPSFCLNSVWNAVPESADGKYSKKRLLNAISPTNNYSGFKCPVEGCNGCNFPKNPDYAGEEDTFVGDKVYGPVNDSFCKIVDFCLEEAWKVGEDLASKPLRSAVRKGAYEYIDEVCDLVSGCNPIGGFICVAAGCTLSAGFSEDGCSGMSGQCAKQKEAPLGPQAVSSELA